MELMRLGGPVMWPLLLISVAALAIVIERFWVSMPLRAPRGITTRSNPAEVISALAEAEALSGFRAALEDPGSDADRITMEGESVTGFMEKRLGILAALAKCATLLGLLGTVLGMIGTFSVIASARGGVDMSLLAEGLWQALITTAAGLVIAIPSYIALAFFEARAEAMAKFLTLAANIVLEGRRSAEKQKPASGNPAETPTGRPS